MVWLDCSDDEQSAMSCVSQKFLRRAISNLLATPRLGSIQFLDIADIGQVFAATDIGKPIVPTDIGEPIEPSDIGEPIEPSDIGKPSKFIDIGEIRN